MDEETLAPRVESIRDLPEETILDEFLPTNRYFEPEIRAMRKQLARVKAYLQPRADSDARRQSRRAEDL